MKAKESMRYFADEDILTISFAEGKYSHSDMLSEDIFLEKDSKGHSRLGSKYCTPQSIWQKERFP